MSVNELNQGISQFAHHRSDLVSPAADINLGLIRYVLHQENVQETMDNFKFLVKDSKPNVVSDNVFHIQWSLISFEHKRFVDVGVKAACFTLVMEIIRITVRFLSLFAFVCLCGDSVIKLESEDIL